MAIAPYIRRLRELVGTELLVLPSAAVLPRDESGRVLLVRVIDTGQWAATQRENLDVAGDAFALELPAASAALVEFYA